MAVQSTCQEKKQPLVKHQLEASK